MHHSPLVSVGFFCERAALADGESVLEERVQDQEYASRTSLFIFRVFLACFFFIGTSESWVAPGSRRAFLRDEQARAAAVWRVTARWRVRLSSGVSPSLVYASESPSQ